MTTLQKWIVRIFHIDNTVIYHGYNDEEYVEYGRKRWKKGYNDGFHEGSLNALNNVKRDINLLVDRLPDNYPYIETKQIIMGIINNINNLLK